MLDADCSEHLCALLSPRLVFAWCGTCRSAAAALRGVTDDRFALAGATDEHVPDTAAWPSLPPALCSLSRLEKLGLLSRLPLFASLSHKEQRKRARAERTARHRARAARPCPWCLARLHLRLSRRGPAFVHRGHT